MLNMLPNAQIIHPCNLNEFDKWLDVAIESKKTYFIQTSEENIPINNIQEEIVQIRTGKRLTILPIGSLMGKAVKTSNILKDIEVLYIPRLKPFKIKLLKRYLEKTKKLLILEDGFVRSGIGETIISQLNLLGVDCKYKIIGASDKFPIQGSLNEVYEDYGLSDENILNEAQQLILK